MNWSSEIPTTPGYYWVWGDPHCPIGRPPHRFELHVCKVLKGANSLMYICDGAFTYPKGNPHIKWMPLTTPAPPDEG